MEKEVLLNELITRLILENKSIQLNEIPTDYDEKRKLLRALMNIRMPEPISEETLKIQDELLKQELKAKEIINPYSLPTVVRQFTSAAIPFAERFVLWKGDITTICADAIVNAANSKLLGCFIPMHRCIDNAIHSASGIQLRLECNKIMKKQGLDEPTGCAQITKAYNLPSKYVLHTVGPIIYNKVTEEDCKLLVSCYTSCLDKANEYKDIQTITFCSISTGEFRFPKEIAAGIAVETVSNWLRKHENGFKRIIFNVFTEEDYSEYAKQFK